MSAATRPTREALLRELADARAAGDRARVSSLLGKLMLTPHSRPDGDPEGGTTRHTTHKIHGQHGTRKRPSDTTSDDPPGGTSRRRRA